MAQGTRLVSPHIKFQISLDLDKQTIVDFWKLKYGGIDFGLGIRQLHPDLDKMSSDDVPNQRKVLYQYVDEYYQTHRKTLIQTQLSFNQQWLAVGPVFFEEAARIFRNHPWSDGEYACYLSILNCNPRFLHNKTFQVFYQKSDFVHTICHELLHFLFFDYVQVKRPHIVRDIDQEVLWELSEIFNVVVLGLPGFQSMPGMTKPIAYPSHQEKIAYHSKVWEESESVDDYFDHQTSRRLR